MTPLGSVDESQERVRVVAVGEAISIAGGLPRTIKSMRINCYISSFALPSSGVLMLMETESLLPPSTKLACIIRTEN